jgi:hypothetical protein
LAPQWVNTAGSKPQTVAFYDLAEGYLEITGNISVFISATLGEQIYRVNFTFVQTSVQNCSGSCVSNYPYPYYGSSGYPNFGPYGLPNYGVYGYPYSYPYGYGQNF